jgi:hypothetical protein
LLVLLLVLVLVVEMLSKIEDELRWIRLDGALVC